MYHSSLMPVFIRKWKTLFVWGLLSTMLFTLLSLLFPLEYRADAGVYIISKSRYGVDPYTVVKSAEQVGQNIVQVIKTQDFFDKVMARSGATLDKSQFENVSDRVRMKRWEKVVDGSVVFGTGVLNISSYSTDPAQAKLLSSAIVSTLVEQGYEYVGGDVTIKLVNKPIVTRFPARPNLPVNATLGFMFGVVFASVVVLNKSKKNLV